MTAQGARQCNPVLRKRGGGAGYSAKAIERKRSKTLSWWTEEKSVTGSVQGSLLSEEGNE
jgi:hypothetical protein